MSAYFLESLIGSGLLIGAAVWIVDGLLIAMWGGDR